MENVKDKIYCELVLLSVSVGQKQEEARLKIYVESLMAYEPESVIQAIRSVMMTTRFFPAIVDIIEKIKSPNGTTDEQAVMVANKIFEAITRFGSYQWAEAKEFLGEDVVGIVERFGGGWTDLCRVEYDEIPTTKAQLRELAKAYIGKSKREFHGGDFHINTTPISFDKNSGMKKLEVPHV